MDTTIGKLFVGLGFKTDSGSVNAVQAEAAALKGTLSKILGVVGVAFTVTGIKNFIQETSSAYADFKAVNTQFEQTFREMKDVASESLSTVAENTGIAETRMKSSFTKMAAFAMTTGMDTSQAVDFSTRAMQALADNAAYFDKSIEYTQDIFQRLLKGNFQLDDNLGFNLAESERNAMAQSLFGAKSYNDLEDWQKEELILQKLIEANNAIGATDSETGYSQAFEESKQYTNQVGELSDALLQLRVSIGSIFLEPMLNVMTKIKEVAFRLADALGNVEEKGSIAARMAEKLNRIVDRGIRYVDKGIQVIKVIKNLLGGTTNTLNLLKYVLGTIMGFIVLDKTVSTLTKINWKLVGILAIVVLIAVAIQDIVFFFQGKNSAFGDILESMGIDKESVRQNGIASLEDLKNTFLDFGNTVVDFYSENEEEIDEILEALAILADLLIKIAGISFDGLLGVVNDLAEGIVRLVENAKSLFGWFKTGDTATAMEDFAETRAKENDYLSSENTFYSRIARGINDKFGTSLPETMSGMVDFRNKLSISATQMAGSAAKTLGIESNLSEEDRRRILAAGAKMYDTDVTTLASGALEKPMGELYENQIKKAEESGYDFGDAFVVGISGSPLMGGILGVAQMIADVLGHSKPKTGPLSNDDTWMPDMMQNFIDGINSKKGEFESVVKGLAAIVNDNLGGIMDLGSSGTSLVGRSAGKNTSVVQNISFSNTFNGDTRQNQIKAGNAMKSSADDTSTYLANAIAFGR